MQKVSVYVCIILFILTGLLEINGQKLDHVLGEVIIEVKHDRGLNLLMEELSEDSQMRSSLSARQIMSEPMNLWVIKTNPNTVNEIDLLHKITMHHEVLLAQKNHLPTYRAIPNDPLFNNQWQFLNTGQNSGVVGADIDIDLAWDITTGGVTTDGDTIVVCVIDDGINPNHPDFGDNLWINHNEILNNDVDDDGNGYVDDYYGWSAFSNDGNVYVGGGHGTPVTGIVGAKGNNGIGVSGCLWDVKLMIVNGEGPEDKALASYAYPYIMRKLYNDTNGDKGAFVVSTNASWGVANAFPEDAPIWCDFYNKLGEVGILNFGATVNSNSNIDEVGDLPTACASDFLVSVTNMNKEDEKVSSAGFGFRSIDLGAYGNQVYTVNSNAYGNFAGTSGATPHVTGTAALLYATDCPDFTSLVKSDPALAALVVKDCILFGVKPNQSLAGITTTGGGLNAFNAVENLISVCGDCSDVFGGYIDEITFESGILTWYNNGNQGMTSIRYKDVNEEDWIEIENVQSGFEFDNLSNCSAYEFQTKTVCSNNPNPSYSYSKVFETTGCCTVPTGININLEDQTATIVWDEVFNATNYIVEWRLASETDWTIADLGENNVHMIDNIQECEFYKVRIKTKCETFNSESEYSEEFDIETDCQGCIQEFCSFTTKEIGDEWIQSVEIIDVFENVSGVSENGYSSFFGQFEIELYAEEEYSLVLSPGHSGIMYAEYFSAFIDYNQDGEFGENETIFSSEFGTMQPVSEDFTVPQNAVDGITRMRIVMRFGQVNGPCDEFGFDFGEIEDYCVLINGDTDCPTDLNTTVTDTTETTLTFEFNQHPQIDSYVVLLREKGNVEFDTIISSNNEVIVSDLKECTPYEYNYGFLCQGGDYWFLAIQEVSTKCELSTGNVNNYSLNIYPNPSFGNLILELNAPVKSDASIELITVDGKIYQMENKIIENARSINIDTEGVPSGVYFIQVKFDRYRLIKKWVKL